MTRLHRASTIVVFSVLTSVATADAECAWVLWSVSGTIPAKDVSGKRTTITYSPVDWKSVRAFATARECETTERESSIRAEFETLKQVKPEVTTVTRDIFRCFPDTVDPRGPKGK